MRITSHSNKQITIAGTEAEMDALQKMVAGLGYVACGREGMPLFAERYEAATPLPDPVCAAHFSPAGPSAAKYTAEGLKHRDALKGLTDEGCLSLYVEHLCGYDYTPENYAREAAKMAEFGFVCMRSPRGSDGRYWEAWFLPGLWAAEGRLKNAKDIPAAINLLIQNVRPGSISAVRQRCALTIDD